MEPLQKRRMNKKDATIVQVESIQTWKLSTMQPVAKVVQKENGVVALVRPKNPNAPIAVRENTVQTMLVRMLNPCVPIVLKVDFWTWSGPLAMNIVCCVHLVLFKM